ncbi:hypothetical protein BC826DRAFT_46673 [Russula brevipes]|nr:hypothetical protein BC826DRAFT_46673 [Russula brevipes]
MFPTALLPVAHCLSFPTSSRLQPRAVRQRARARPHPTCSRSKMSGVRVREWHGCHRHPLSYGSHPFLLATASVRQRPATPPPPYRHCHPSRSQTSGGVCDNVRPPHHHRHPPRSQTRRGGVRQRPAAAPPTPPLACKTHGGVCDNVRPPHRRRQPPCSQTCGGSAVQQHSAPAPPARKCKVVCDNTWLPCHPGTCFHPYLHIYPIPMSAV